jgi:hypothetical protein
MMTPLCKKNLKNTAKNFPDAKKQGDHGAASLKRRQMRGPFCRLTA